jgi:truncated hemoglobin YjbI
MSHRVLSLTLLALLSCALLIRGDETLDARIRAAIVDAINEGAPLYNRGQTSSCYYLYLGVLQTADRLLDHRPALRKSVRAAMKKGRESRTFAEGAVALREGMDEVLKAMPRMAQAKKPLWDRLGGEKGVRAVVKEFVKRAAADPKVNFDRGGQFTLDRDAVAALEQRLVELVSAVGGGPLKYTGRDMKTAHKGMKITDAEFDALAGHLVAVLKQFKVPDAETKELLDAVAATRKDIVEVKSLYDRLGGEKAITAVVDDFVARAAKNPRVNFTRKGTGAEWLASDENIARLKKHLVQFISLATGGPKKYDGRDMKSAHKGMKITDAEFDALAGDLEASLQKFEVPRKELDELLEIVGSTRSAIVEMKEEKE